MMVTSRGGDPFMVMRHTRQVSRHTPFHREEPHTNMDMIAVGPRRESPGASQRKRARPQIRTLPTRIGAFVLQNSRLKKSSPPDKSENGMEDRDGSRRSRQVARGSPCRSPRKI